MAEVTRTVTGVVMQAGGAPWAGARVTFDLSPGSYTAGAVYPARRLTATTGEDGAFAVDLWPTEEGDVPTAYAVRVPSGETYSFRLPLGDGSPIALSVLIAADIDEQDPRYATLLAALDGPASAATAAAIAADAAATRADTAAGAAEAVVDAATQAVQDATAIIASTTTVRDEAEAAALAASTAAGDAAAAAARADAAAGRLSYAALLQSGPASLGTNVLPPGLVIPYAGTLETARLMAGTAPAGSALTVVVRRAGVALATLTLAAGATTVEVTGLTVSLAAWDVLTFDVTAIGVDSPGADLLVVLAGGL